MAVVAFKPASNCPPSHTTHCIANILICDSKELWLGSVVVRDDGYKDTVFLASNDICNNGSTAASAVAIKPTANWFNPPANCPLSPTTLSFANVPICNDAESFSVVTGVRGCVDVVVVAGSSVRNNGSTAAAVLAFKLATNCPHCTQLVPLLTIQFEMAPAGMLLLWSAALSTTMYQLLRKM